ncbi:hypothetical protein [Pseudonocardia sp. ICBG601]|uniref:hypothetical protein n=1 Tax=Pseudonocardia sp. ICBG601 TaxID=2846759 RepID=UPI001CF6A406|nr:hypothetical protein [Pseudonocardia sp. ICBG601]
MSTTTYAQRTITVILDAAIPMSMTTGFAAAPVQHTSSPTSITTPATPLSTALPSNHSDEEIARALERIATELEHALASLPSDQRDNPHAVRDAGPRQSRHVIL